MPGTLQDSGNFQGEKDTAFMLCHRSLEFESISIAIWDYFTLFYTLILPLCLLKENRIDVFIYTLFIFFLNRKVVLLAGWALFLFLAYKVSKTDREYQEYNPYEVLNLDPVSSIFI